MIISQYDAASESIRCAASWVNGEKQDVTAYPVIPLAPEGRGVQSTVIRSGRARVFEDYPQNRGTAVTEYYITDAGELADEPQLDEQHPQSCLAVPVKVGGEVAGTSRSSATEPMPTRRTTSGSWRRSHPTSVRR